MEIKLLFFFLLIFQGVMTRAQYSLHLRVKEPPVGHAPGDTVYVAGNFNEWRPADERYRLQQEEGGTWDVTIRYKEIPGDRLEFKFTRGSWQKFESTAKGRLTGPRIAPIYRDTILDCRIEGWRDDFPTSTASENVHILDSAFYMPQLDRSRKIWIYLPADYEDSKKGYPVLYLHDGQHLFDEATSVGRIGPIEWAVDEALDAAPEPCIVVGINHNEDMKARVGEYFYHSPDGNAPAEGAAYLKFIVETLKPYVDRHYRTLPEREYTGMAGSSMGGLITLYGGLRYPEVFGRVGVFSPSVWMDNEHIFQELRKLHKGPEIRRQQYFFYAGGQERRQKEDKTFVDMTEDVERVIDVLRTESGPDIELMTVPHGRHGALYWRETFPVFYDWFINGMFVRRGNGENTEN